MAKRCDDCADEYECFWIDWFFREIGRENDLLEYTAKLLPHYGEDWWMMSMHAISLCETGQTLKSMQLMEKALNLNPRNANAAHFLRIYFMKKMKFQRGVIT